MNSIVPYTNQVLLLLEQLTPWTRGRVKLLQSPYFSAPSPHAFNSVTPTHRHFVLSSVSLTSRDQDGGPSDSTIDIYDLTEKYRTVSSLHFSLRQVTKLRQTFLNDIVNLIHLSIKMTTPHQSGAPFVGEHVFQYWGVWRHASPPSASHRELSHAFRIWIKDQTTFIARVLRFVAAILNF